MFIYNDLFQWFTYLCVQIYALVIAVNSFSQWVKRFKVTQINTALHLQKTLIEDIITHWNSFYFMLKQIYEMYKFSKEWINEEKSDW